MSVGPFTPLFTPGGFLRLVADSSPEPSLVAPGVPLCSEEAIHVLHVRRISGHLREPPSDERLVEQLVAEPDVRERAAVAVEALDVELEPDRLAFERIRREP